jgi:hypothetical protein
MSNGLTPETKIDRVADDLVGVIQALRLMSDMQRQQGELLNLIITLLIPESAEPRDDLGKLLRQLVGMIQQMVVEVRMTGEGLQTVTRHLPDQLAEAIDAALQRAETQGSRR